jgi:hypothetical protein
MPQLVKGGKYVFGWTKLNPDLRIRIPDETYHEYHLNRSEKLIIISGSKTSGGFGVVAPDSLIKSKMGSGITYLAGYIKESDSFSTEKLEILRSGKRFITWTCLDKEKYFTLSDKLADLLNIRINDKLLVARGSGVGPAFIARGRIYDEALKHKNIPEFC